MKTEPSYVWRRLQGHFNSRKKEFIEALKQRGTFLEYCEKRGFLYSVSIVAFDDEMSLIVGLKNGDIKIHRLNGACLQQAV